MFLLHLADGRHWPDTHDFRINSGSCDGGDARERLQVFCWTNCSLATMTAAAPSVMPEEFPAVTVPVFEKTGFSFVSFSSVELGNGCSSAAKACGLLACKSDRNNFILESPFCNCGSGALLGSQSELILLLARNLVPFRQYLGGFTISIWAIGQKNPSRCMPIDDFLVPEAVPETSAFQVIGQARHGLGAARENAFGIS